MKTLYYEMEIRVPQLFLNKGFIKAEIDKEIKMLGVLTRDVFVGEEKDGQIYFSYFVCNYQKRTFDEVFEFSINLEDFQLPQRFDLKHANGNDIRITIERKIQEQLKKEQCDRIIDKTINVFENESE